MKILFVGNSQLACLKQAYDAGPEILADHSAHFYVFPGGQGPNFDVVDQRLKVWKEATNPDFPPYDWPEGTRDIPLGNFDVIVVSALGNLYGSFLYPGAIPRQGLLYEFGPKPNDVVQSFLSKPCYRRVIDSALRKHQGFIFLRKLRNSYHGRIIVQPFPLVSSMLLTHPEWIVNQLYDDVQAAHQFFYQTRDQTIAAASAEIAADLLPYPDPEWAKCYFTPGEYMSQSDGLHPFPSYGRLVLEQVARRISR
jgi:hypothetical protein